MSRIVEHFEQSGSIKLILSISDYATRLAVLFGIFNYFYESSDRAEQRHYQAWQLVNAAHGKPGDAGRRQALQALVRDGVDLRQIDLTNADLSGADLRGAQMEKAVLDHVTLAKAKFGCRRWPALDAIPVQVFPCLTTSSLDRARISHSDLREADFSYASLYGATLHKVDLSETNFTGARLDGSRFVDTGADANFTKASLVNVEFIKVTMIGAYFSQADLQSVMFEDLSAPEGVFFDDANLYNVTINGVMVTHENILRNEGGLFDCCHFCRTRVGGRYGRGVVEVNRDCAPMGDERRHRSE